MFGFSTRNVDVVAVSATAGTCRTEPEKTFDPVSHLEIVVPDMINISCQGGTLAPGGSITATVTIKGKSPGVVSDSPGFGISGMQDSTPLQKWWEYPQFRVGVYQAPAVPTPPAFVDPTPLDQAELAAPAGGLLKVAKKGTTKLTASCHVAAGCPQATLFYTGGKGKTKIAGQAKLRALANGKTTTVTLKLTKKQLKALKAAKKKGVQITITGGELTITATLLAGKSVGYPARLPRRLQAKGGPRGRPSRDQQGRGLSSHTAAYSRPPARKRGSRRQLLTWASRCSRPRW